MQKKNSNLTFISTWKKNHIVYQKRRFPRLQRIEINFVSHKHVEAREKRGGGRMSGQCNLVMGGGGGGGDHHGFDGILVSVDGSDKTICH